MGILRGRRFLSQSVQTSLGIVANQLGEVLPELALLEKSGK